MVPVGDKLNKAPRNAKELMATRLLEGHFVRCQCRGIQVCDSAPCLALAFVGVVSRPTYFALFISLESPDKGSIVCLLYYGGPAIKNIDFSSLQIQVLWHLSYIWILKALAQAIWIFPTPICDSVSSIYSECCHCCTVSIQNRARKRWQWTHKSFNSNTCSSTTILTSRYVVLEQVFLQRNMVTLGLFVKFAYLMDVFVVPFNSSRECWETWVCSATVEIAGVRWYVDNRILKLWISNQIFIF